MKRIRQFLSAHIKLIIVVTLFAAGGVLFVARSSAATFVTAIEAEEGVLAGNYTAGTTAGASNGQSVQFGATITPPTPTPPTPTPPMPTAQSLYVTPASGSFTVGSDIVVEIRAHSGATLINAVQADIAYSSNLQYVSSDISASAFSVAAQNTGGSGVVTIALGTITPVSGDQLIAKVTFKVLAAGSGTIDLKDTSSALAADDSQNVITTRRDGSYTLQ